MELESVRARTSSDEDSVCVEYTLVGRDPECTCDELLLLPLATGEFPPPPPPPPPATLGGRELVGEELCGECDVVPPGMAREMEEGSDTSLRGLMGGESYTGLENLLWLAAATLFRSFSLTTLAEEFDDAACAFALVEACEREFAGPSDAATPALGTPPAL